MMADLGGLDGFLQACEGLSSGSALARESGEQYMLQLRESGGAIPRLCRALFTYLDSAQSPPTHARFHAANIVKQVAVQQWGAWADEDKSGEHSVRNLFVQQSLREFVPVHERKSMLNAAALLVRLSYTFGDESSSSSGSSAYVNHRADARAFIYSILELIRTPISVEADYQAAARAKQLHMVGVEMCVELVADFDLALFGLENGRLGGLPPHLLKVALLEFGRSDLVHIFTELLSSISRHHAQERQHQCSAAYVHAAATAAPAPAASNGNLLISVNLLNLVLSSGIFSVGTRARTRTDAVQTSVGELVVSRPGEHWRNVLGDVRALLSLWESLYELSVSSSVTSDAAFGDSLRLMLVLLANIHPESFAESRLAVDHLMSLIDVLQRKQFGVSAHIQERQCFADVWKRLSCAHSILPVLFERGVWGACFQELCSSSLSNFALLTSAGAGPFKGLQDSSQAYEIADPLLETWRSVALELQDFILGRDSSPVMSTLESIMQRTLFHVALGFVQAELVYLSEGLDAKDEDGDLVEEVEDLSIEEARLDNVALLFRTSVDCGSLEALSALISDTTARYYQLCESSAEGVSGHAWSTHHERAYFLVEVAGRVLADNGLGEVPSVPEEFLGKLGFNGANRTSESVSPIQCLGLEVLRAAENETMMLHSAQAFNVSPYVGAALGNALRRMALSYFFCPLDQEEIVLDLWDEQIVQSARVLCLKKAIETVCYRGGEYKLDVSYGVLLGKIAERLEQAGAGRRFQACLLPDIWAPLINAPMESFQSLPRSVMKHVGYAMTVAHCRLDGAPSFVGRLGDFLHNICAHSASQVSGNAAEHVNVCLNLLHGSFGLREPLADHAFRAASAQVLVYNAVSLHKLFVGMMPKVCRVLLRVLEHFVHAQGPMLSAAETKHIFAQCLALMQSEATFLSRGVSDESSKVSHLKCCFRLLGVLLDQDPSKCEEYTPQLDASSRHQKHQHLPDTNGHHCAEPSEIVLAGTKLMVEHMKNDYLSYPKLRHAYYSFQFTVVEFFPLQLQRLPAELAFKYFNGLEFMFSGLDSTVRRRTLRAIGSLANLNARQRAASAPGFGASFGEHFLRTIFIAFLGSVHGFESEVSDLCSALIALIRCSDGTPDLLLRCLTDAIEYLRKGQPIQGAHLLIKPELERFVIAVFQEMHAGALEEQGGLKSYLADRKVIEKLVPSAESFQREIHTRMLLSN
ncbi:Exportin-4 [Porphyridium purpureum]|uniref:Exportin-4 n=1 Tax=Porphyridium purpureum TaxID=35688 RepID=A0A5J4YJR9_PORPP|nr:Exportin-4 [Porphyridium purpureum]|eukprot:POR1521..scf297_16